MTPIAPRYAVPFTTAFDAVGVVAPEALLYFYLTGSSTPAATYADYTLSTPNANPVQANAAGLFGNIFLDPSITYKVTLKTVDGDEIWTADPVVGVGLPDGVEYGFATTTALLAAFGAGDILSNGTLAQTAGRTSVNDGGGGLFRYNSADTTTPDNGGTIRVDAQNRRWYFVGASPTVALFGAFADGTDAATGINLAAAALPNSILLIPGDTGGTYVIQSSLVLATSTTALGMQGIGGTPTIQAGSSFSTSTDMVTIGGSANPRSWISLSNINFDANTKARRCVTLQSGNSVTYNLCSFSNSRAAALAFECGDSGGSPQWIEKLTINQCTIQSAGTDAVLFSLSGSTGAFINEVIIEGGRFSGISKIASGGYMMHFSLSASSPSSTITNLVFVKPHFDVQFNSGQLTIPSADVIVCDNGAISNMTLINPQIENTGTGSMSSGYTINKSGSGSINGVRGVSVSNNSGYGTLGLNSSVTDAAWDSYSFGFETFRGPTSTNGLSGTTGSISSGNSASMFTTPANTGAVYLVCCTGGDNSPTYAAGAVVATDGAGTWNVAYTSGTGTHVTFLGSGTTLSVHNVDLSANTFKWSAIRQI